MLALATVAAAMDAGFDAVPHKNNLGGLTKAPDNIIELLEALLELEGPVHFFASTFAMDRNFFNNKTDLSSEIKSDTSSDLTFEARTVHQNDPDFPVLVPDLWYVGTRKNHTTVSDYVVINDDEERRCYYLRKMNAHRRGRSTTWKKNCKHLVPGGFYQDIVNRFYVVPMDGLTVETKGGTKNYRIKKYYIKVSV